MDLKEIVWMAVEWIHLAVYTDSWQGAVMTVINQQVPYSVGNFLYSWVAVGFA
jgi:hypothetical protein